MRINYEIFKQGLRVLNETELLDNSETTEFAYGEKEMFMTVGEVVRYYRRKLRQITHGRRDPI